MGGQWRVSPRASRVSSRQVSHEQEPGGPSPDTEPPRGPLLRGGSRSNSPLPLAAGIVPAALRRQDVKLP